MIFFPDFYLGGRGTEFEKLYFKAVRVLGRAALASFDKHGRFSFDERDRVLNSIPDRKIREMAKGVFEDWYMNFSAAVMEEFSQDKTAHIYRISTPFVQAMSRMDVEIRDELLPQKFLAYIAFSPAAGLRDSDGKRVVGAYVSFLGKEDLRDEEERQYTEEGDRIFRVVYQTESSNKLMVSFEDCGYLMVKLKVGEKFDQAMARLSKDMDIKQNMPKDDSYFSPSQDVLFRTFLNLTMYLHSLNPDVSHLKPAHLQTANERKTQIASGIDLSNSKYPVTLVSWNYGQGKEFSVDSTLVRAHHRWQPCGPGRGQTRLIIVREHERHYKKDEARVIEVKRDQG